MTFELGQDEKCDSEEAERKSTFAEIYEVFTKSPHLVAVVVWLFGVLLFSPKAEIRMAWSNKTDKGVPPKFKKVTNKSLTFQQRIQRLNKDSVNVISFSSGQIASAPYNCIR